VEEVLAEEEAGEDDKAEGNVDENAEEVDDDEEVEEIEGSTTEEEEEDEEDEAAVADLEQRLKREQDLRELLKKRYELIRKKNAEEKKQEELDKNKENEEQAKEKTKGPELDSSKLAGDPNRQSLAARVDTAPISRSVSPEPDKKSAKEEARKKETNEADANQVDDKPVLSPRRKPIQRRRIVITSDSSQVKKIPEKRRPVKRRRVVILKSAEGRIKEFSTGKKHIKTNEAVETEEDATQRVIRLIREKKKKLKQTVDPGEQTPDELGDSEESEAHLNEPKKPIQDFDVPTTSDTRSQRQKHEDAFRKASAKIRTQTIERKNDAGGCRKKESRSLYIDEEYTVKFKADKDEPWGMSACRSFPVFVETVKGGQALTNKVAVGDVIIEVDGTSVLKTNYNDIFDLLTKGNECMIRFGKQDKKKEEERKKERKLARKEKERREERRERERDRDRERRRQASSRNYQPYHTRGDTFQREALRLKRQRERERERERASRRRSGGRDRDEKDRGRDRDDKERGRDRDEKDRGRDKDDKDRGRVRGDKDRGRDRDEKDRERRRYRRERDEREKRRRRDRRRSRSSSSSDAKIRSMIAVVGAEKRAKKRDEESESDKSNIKEPEPQQEKKETPADEAKETPAIDLEKEKKDGDSSSGSSYSSNSDSDSSDADDNAKEAQKEDDTKTTESKGGGDDAKEEPPKVSQLAELRHLPTAAEPEEKPAETDSKPEQPKENLDGKSGNDETSKAP